MDRRLLMFLMLAMLLVGLNAYFAAPKIRPKAPPAADAKKPTGAQDVVAKEAAKKGDKEAADAKPAAGQAKVEAEKAAEPPEVAKVPPAPLKRVTLGSADPKSPYRMLVTLTSRGAAVERIELNSPNYRDLEDRGGYLGHLSSDRLGGADGCLVDVVGPGTPAAAAGLRPGDLIKQIDDKPVRSAVQFADVLAKRRPGQKVSIAIVRDGQPQTLGPVALGRRPLEVVRPEGDDPLSFLLTMYQVDDQKLSGDEKLVDDTRELNGLDLRTGTWEVVPSANADEVVFRRVLPRWGLEVYKTYRLARVPDNSERDPDAKAYHLLFGVKLVNTAKAAHKVAYQLDGPTGLPTEGYWYANKVGYGWGAAGLRDVVVSFDGKATKMIECPTIAEDKFGPPWQGQTVSFIGVDAQYFSSVLIPQGEKPDDLWFAESQPLRMGKVDKDWPRLTNTSFRLVSREHALTAGESLSHQFVVFAGPKRPGLLSQYGVGDLVYYGWFGLIAIPMLWLLHGFFAVVRNYGVAIVLLTAVVRLCMFPLSRKQALGAQIMQKLQPELKKIQEKYKNDLEGRGRAQQELFRKYNYHPLSGCLVVFIQLPIFVALYRSLMVDVELRQAPLISESIRWCSNLSAPDMLFDWQSFMPTFLTQSAGMFGLGPYFNILPLVTIVLFLWQQKKLMPPPADETAAMQQKMMQWMMIFMGVLFFKVASGLCIYFIASSLWGLGERKFLPKFVHASQESPATAYARATERDAALQRSKKARRSK